LRGFPLVPKEKLGIHGTLHKVANNFLDSKMSSDKLLKFLSVLMSSGKLGKKGEKKLQHQRRVQVVGGI
jgi:hypothetical protein